MRKFLFLYTAVICLMFALTVTGQSSFSNGFKYQGALRDASSLPLANQTFDLKINIVGEEVNYYSEIQRIQTDQNGIFELVIGQGKDQNGLLSELPWASEALWIQVEMAKGDSSNFEQVSKSPLMAVPYALHAYNTSALHNVEVIDEPIEKNGSQSIYWTTSGNLKTNPNVHFIGSRDNVAVQFKTNNQPYLTLTTNGKLQLISNVPPGPKSDKNSYQMIVEGTQNIQGVWVQIKGTRSKSNNFVTFADDTGVKGRIEGQTLSELENSDSYKVQEQVNALNITALTAKIVEITAKIVSETITAAAATIVCIVTFGLAGCSDIDASVAGAVSSGVKAAGWVVELAAYITASTRSKDRIRNNVGVSYASGNGDYAEWLLRDPNEKNLTFGEIVSVRGGIVSRNTSSSIKNMVVSQNPAFLGKVPAKGTESKYEKIAFMGQVPVRVVGKVQSGDYILPSGNNDGLGIAIHPSKMTITDYQKIVGVAWETVDNNLPFNMVNAAVGIRSNQLAGQVNILEEKINTLMNYIEGKGPLHPEGNVSEITSNSKQPASHSLDSAPSLATLTKKYNSEDFNKLVDFNAGYFKSMFGNIEKKLKDEGQDLSHPAIAQLFQNPISTLKRMHDNPKAYAEWVVSLH